MAATAPRAPAGAAGAPGQATPHPAGRWRLVGPWYRWTRPGVPADGLVSAPAIQMFAGSDFVDRFLARPQRSLRADPVVDVVQAHDLVAAGSFATRVSTLFPLRADGSPAPRSGAATVYRARPAPGSLRKLYQAAHDRHYLVSCELHCDEPGFPRVERSQVCQAGFVLRRRRSLPPPGLSADAVRTEHAKLHRAEAERHALRELEQAAQALTLAGAPDGPLRQASVQRQAALAAEAGVASWAALVALREQQVAQARQALADWLQAKGVRTVVEGWFPAAEGGETLGAWRALDTAAQTADPMPVPHARVVRPGIAPPTDEPAPGEQIHPLLPLVADPRDPAHDAAGRTLYWGLVPTASRQHDAAGQPRIDERSTYELRCFVRAHHPCPPRSARQPDCHGPVVWSRPTEAFRVAPAMDVLGSANRPVTIRMPDLRELAAQAAQRPRGRLSPVRFSQPQHLSPLGDGGRMGGEAICSFSIPLISIVALFLLNLFLPIVVFIFQLWFLLVFRLCIPPQVQAGAAIDAALAATPPGVDLDADFAVSVGGVPQSAAQLGNAMRAAMQGHIREDTGKTDETADLAGLANSALAPVHQAFADQAALPGSIAAPPTDTSGTDAPAPALPPTGPALQFEPAVQPQWTPPRPAASGA
jgi:hypothetical protein